MAFVESLHESLKKTAVNAAENQSKYLDLAASYIEDGLEDSECIELLMVDGLSKEASESYLMEARNQREAEEEEVDGFEYRFQFEDDRGNVWSSYDIGIVLHAASEADAREKAEQLLGKRDDFEMERLISVSRIS